MSAPPADVVDRLERLADHAPRGAAEPHALWEGGRLRQRRRTASMLAGVVAAGVLATAMTPAVLSGVEPPIAAPSQQMVLPDVLRAPGPWDPAFSVTPRRLSAVGVGQRSNLVSSSATLWGVSAATGESRWLELPGAVPSAGAEAQLSADGRRLAYWVTGETSEEPLATGGTEDGTPVVGVAVMNLETGEVARWDVDSDHGLSVDGLVWAGDVLWWQAGPVVRLGTGVSRAEIRTRTWHLETGERLELGGKDERAAVNLSQPGHAPRGFVTLPRAFRLEHVTEADAPVDLRMDLPPDAPSAAGLVDPQMAPDGVRIAALMMRDATVFDDSDAKELLVGSATVGTVVLEPVGGVGAQALLGWRSPTEIVVVHPSTGGDTDGDGARETRELWIADLSLPDRPGFEPWIVVQSNSMPTFAMNAWRGDVIAAPDAPFAPDPRVVGLAGMVVIVFCVSLWRDLRRRRGHP